jgi:AcrR family transcriptional regulator
MARNTTKARPPKGALKEAAILETAWRLLSEKPLSEISVDDLAKGAGIHRSSFYFYFESREAVISALAVRTIEELRQATFDLVDVGEGPAERIRTVVTGLLERWRTQGQAMRAMASIYDQNAELRTFWDRVNDDIISSIADWIDQERAQGIALAGPPAADVVRALSDMIWRAGYQMSLRAPVDTLDPTLVETLTVIAHRAIYGGGT